MSEAIESAGQATEQPVVEQNPVATTWIGGFAPGQSSPDPLAPPKEPEKPATPAPKAPEVKAEPLAELIRARREERQARERIESQHKSTEKRVEELTSELTRFKSARNDFLADPIGYAKANNWTKEEQILVGQALIYDIVPDKAPPDFRSKLMDLRDQRKEKQAQDAAAKAEQERATQAYQQELTSYATGLNAAAQNFEEGSHPESEAWFGDDHDTYMNSLMATARNLAAVANSEGRVADLSPAAVAAVLEQEVATRMARRDEQRSARTATPAPAVKPDQGGGKQAAVTESPRGMQGSGGPRPPARTESERLQRAIEAGWATK